MKIFNYFIKIIMFFSLVSCMKLQMAPISMDVSASKGTYTDRIKLSWGDYPYAKGYAIYRTPYKKEYIEDTASITPEIDSDESEIMEHTDFGDPIAEVDQNATSYEDMLEDLEDGQDRSALYVYRIVPKLTDDNGDKTVGGKEQYKAPNNKNIIGYTKNSDGVTLTGNATQVDGTETLEVHLSEKKFNSKLIYGPGRLFDIDTILLGNNACLNPKWDPKDGPCPESPAEKDIVLLDLRDSSNTAKTNPILYPTTYNFMVLTETKDKNMVLGNVVTGYRKIRDILEFANLVDATMYSMFFKMIPLGDKGSFVPGFREINGVFGNLQGEFWINGGFQEKPVGPNKRPIKRLGGEAFIYQDQELIIEGGLASPFTNSLDNLKGGIPYPLILQGSFTIKSADGKEGYDGKMIVSLAINNVAEVSDGTAYVAGLGSTASPTNGTTKANSYLTVEWEGKTITAYPYSENFSEKWHRYTKNMATKVAFENGDLALTNKYSFINGAFMPRLQYNDNSDKDPDERVSCPPTHSEWVDAWFGVMTYDRSEDCLPEDPDHAN